MNKQKIILLLAVGVLLISLPGCTKNTSVTTNNDNVGGTNEVIIGEDNNQETETNDENEKDTENNVENIAQETEKFEGTYEYDNKPYNFTIQIPNNWNFVENEYGFTVLVYTPEDGDIHENLGITVQTPQIATNLEDYYKDSMQKIAEVSEGFKELKTSDIEINGLKGKNTIYETIKNDTNVKSQQTVFIDSKNYVYVLQYTATKDTFDKYMDGVNTIIKSFKILD